MRITDNNITIPQKVSSTYSQFTIPTPVLREIAKCFLPNMLAYFETESGRKEFEEWKKEKQLREQSTVDNLYENKRGA